MSGWTLTAQQFRLLWNHFRGGDLPIVFVFGDSARVNADERARVDAMTRNELLSSLTERQAAMFSRLVTTMFRVTVFGKNCATPNHHSPLPSRIRLFTAGHTDGRGLVAARQQPGPDPAAGGSITLTTASTRVWSQTIINALPESPGPGKLPAVAVPTTVAEEIPYERRTYMVSYDDQLKAQTRRMLASPPRGYLTTINSSVGLPGQVMSVYRRSLMLRDEPGDGRYAIIRRPYETDVQPISPRKLTELIRAEFAALQQYRREYEEDRLGY